MQEGQIETITDIWQGWLTFGVGDSSRWLYFSFDVLLVMVVCFIIIRAFNTVRGIGYLALIGLALAVLVISAYITLPGLHLLAQGSLILLVVGLPIYFSDRFRALLGVNSPTAVSPSQPIQAYLNPVVMILVAILGALLIIGLSSDFGNKTAELPSGIPLVAVNLPAGMAASFGSQISVKVIVSADSSRWQSLTEENFSATVDVAKQSAGTYDLPITVTSKVQDIKIVRTNPSRVVVNVEPIIRKTVTVSAKFTGRAGNDLVPDEPIFKPIKVEASGPKSILNDLTQTYIQVKLNGETQKIVQKFGLVALTSNNDIIGSVSFNPTEVEAEINLIVSGNLKTVGIRPTTSGQPASGYWVKSITLDPMTTTVTGSVEALASLTAINTDSFSVAGLSADTTLSVNLALPRGVTVAEGSSKIQAKIDIEETSTTKSITPEIIYDGLSSGLKVAAITPASVSTLVSGSSSILGSLADSTIKLKLNLSPYQSAGTYSITLKSTDFTLPDGVGLVSYLPSALSITLENR